MEFVIIIGVIGVIATLFSIEVNTRVTREQNKKIIELLKQLNDK